MLRRLALIIVVFSFAISSLIFAPQTMAWTFGDEIKSPTDLTKAMDENSTDKILQEFCAKRQGGQMNLETWYSGKCAVATEGGTFSSYSGEGVGFADIVILDLLERITGEKDPTKSFWDKIVNAIKAIKELSESNNNLTPSSNSTPNQNNSNQLQQINMAPIRQELFAGQDSSILGQSGKMITMLFENQPASTRSYLAYVSQNLQQHKIIQPALAANGIGFTTFSPFLTIWIAFRNLAYLGLVTFFIIYGFMMMFRVNLGQKTVISVQLAIPKLIVTLLIITFSFAIVGLIYDLMWVVIAFIFGYFESQGIIYSQTSIIPNAAAGRLGIIPSGILNSLIAGPMAIFGVLNLIFGGIGGLIGTVFSFKGIGIVISIIIIIAVLISYAKLFFKLLTSFISVIISLITAPIILLGNAFPGSNVIGTWLRGIVANLSVFPITMLLLFFSYLLMIQPLLSMCKLSLFDELNPISLFNKGHSCEWVFGVKELTNISQGIYNIPIISTPILGTNASGLLALLGVGLLLMASKYVDMVKDALKVPAFKYGTAIMEALGQGSKVNDKWASKGYDGLPKALQKRAAGAYHTKTKGEDPTWFGVPADQGGVSNKGVLDSLKSTK